MRFIESRWLAAISLGFLLLAGEARATKRPHYGGTLRIELRTPSISLDPREWKTGSMSAGENEKLAALIFDRLVTLDDYGRIQPSLATEWSHDAAAKSWQFKLRPGVKFSDGSPLTPAEAASSLQTLLPSGFQCSASESGIAIRAPHATPDFLEQLATGHYFVFRVQPDNTLLGTGPFFVSENLSATPPESNALVTRSAHMRFSANEEAWAGRPFVDAVDVTLGEPALRQLLDLQMNKADLVELAPDLVRKAHQENLRVWSSAPNTLLALRFDDAQPAVADEHLREALALSLDRVTMAGVLLQRQAEPTAALLPQWLSGYAFLFESPMNLERAKQLRASLPANEAGGSQPLRLRVDASGDLVKLLGERVAVNARQANLSILVIPHTAATSSGSSSTSSAAATAGLHLFAWHYDTVSPRAELDAMTRQLLLQPVAEAAQGGNDPEQLFALERRLVEDRRVLPLVLLPEYVGIAPGVRNWMPARWGAWRLADIWLDRGERTAAAREHATSTNSSAHVPGSRP